MSSQGVATGLLKTTIQGQYDAEGNVGQDDACTRLQQQAVKRCVGGKRKKNEKGTRLAKTAEDERCRSGHKREIGGFHGMERGRYQSIGVPKKHGPARFLQEKKLIKRGGGVP